MALVDNLSEQVKAAAMAVLGELPTQSDLAGFTTAGRVYGQTDPTPGTLVFPHWLVTIDRAREQLLPGDSEWRVRMIVLDVRLRDARRPVDHRRDATYRRWRDLAVDEFHQRRPVTDAVPACIWCEVETRESPDEGGFAAVPLALALSFWIREPRHRNNACLAAVGLQPAPGAGG